MEAIKDQEYLELYELAEKAEKEGCTGCSMKFSDFRLKHPQLRRYLEVYWYNNMLKEIEIEGKTIYMVLRKAKDILTWNLMPINYKSKMGNSGWKHKKWMEIQADGTMKITVY